MSPRTKKHAATAPPPRCSSPSLFPTCASARRGPAQPRPAPASPPRPRSGPPQTRGWTAAATPTACSPSTCSTAGRACGCGAWRGRGERGHSDCFTAAGAAACGCTPLRVAGRGGGAGGRGAGRAATTAAGGRRCLTASGTGVGGWVGPGSTGCCSHRKTPACSLGEMQGRRFVPACRRCSRRGEVGLDEKTGPKKAATRCTGAAAKGPG